MDLLLATGQVEAIRVNLENIRAGCNENTNKMNTKKNRTLKCLILLLLWMTATVCFAQSWKSVELKRKITHPQPMTGLVLWPEQAANRNATYGESIQLEFSYCLPSKVVKGCAEDGTIAYDWSSGKSRTSVGSQIPIRIPVGQRCGRQERHYRRTGIHKGT